MARAWSQIDVHLKRRADLIPKLVEAVKGYMKHEKQLLEKIASLRTQLMQEQNIGEQAAKDQALSGAIKSLFAVAENYPDLKANTNFLQLQEEITGTENKIAYARQFYNNQVLLFNNRLQQVPSNIIGKSMHLSEKPFFEATADEKKDVVVDV